MLMIEDLRRLVGEMQCTVNGGTALTEEIIRPMLCRAGIHDYEFVVINEKGALLECFYCGHQKLSKKLWMKGRR